MNSKLITIGLSVVAIVIAAFALTASPGPTAGNTTASFWNAVGGFRVNGTEVFNSSGVLTGISTGTCSLIASSFTVAASTTVAMDCAVSGVVSGDIVFAQFATSTAAFAGWQIGSASASTTSGYITVGVNNWTGVSGVIPASVASTTKYFFSR